MALNGPEKSETELVPPLNPPAVVIEGETSVSATDTDLTRSDHDPRKENAVLSTENPLGKPNETPATLDSPSQAPNGQLTHQQALDNGVAGDSRGESQAEALSQTALAPENIPSKPADDVGVLEPGLRRRFFRCERGISRTGLLLQLD